MTVTSIYLKPSSKYYYARLKNQRGQWCDKSTKTINYSSAKRIAERLQAEELLKRDALEQNNRSAIQDVTFDEAVELYHHGTLIVFPNFSRTLRIDLGMVPAESIGTSRVMAPPCELIVFTRSERSSNSNRGSVPDPQPSLIGKRRCHIRSGGHGKFFGVRGFPIPFFSCW